MRSRLGVASKGPDGICMVVGCHKKAIYKNARTAKSNKSKAFTSQRGYCSDHRAMAITTNNEKTIDYISDHPWYQ